MFWLWFKDLYLLTNDLPEYAIFYQPPPEDTLSELTEYFAGKYVEWWTRKWAESFDTGQSIDEWACSLKEHPKPLEPHMQSLLMNKPMI